MAWKLEISNKFNKTLSKLDKQTSKRILDFLYNRVAVHPDPRSMARPLTGKLKGCWRYRVDDYRIIVVFKDAELCVLVLSVDHRRKVYK
jgi:mRNA interferase RelE/StbE